MLYKTKKPLIRVAFSLWCILCRNKEHINHSKYIRLSQQYRERVYIMNIQYMLKYMLIATITVIPAIGNAQPISDYVRQYNPEQADYIGSVIEDKGAKYNLDPRFLASIFTIESQFNNNAVSSAGARGIAQLMPDTASGLGVDSSTIEGNIEGGAKYIREMLDTYGGDYSLALAAYNAGPGNVSTYVPSYTTDYVSSVQSVYSEIGGYISPYGSTYTPARDPDRTKKEQLLKLLQLRKLEQLRAYQSRTR